MTFTSPIKLKLAAVAAGLAFGITAAPAQAIVDPIECGKVSAKGKRWRVVADQVPCRTVKKWAVTYIRSFKTPRYYKCKRPADPQKYRVCTATRYNPDRTWFIYKPR